MIGCELAFSRHRRRDSLETAPDKGEVGVLATLSSETSALAGGGLVVDLEEGRGELPHVGGWGRFAIQPGGGGGETDMALTEA